MLPDLVLVTKQRREEAEYWHVNHHARLYVITIKSDEAPQLASSMPPPSVLTAQEGYLRVSAAQVTSTFCCTTGRILQLCHVRTMK